MGKLHSQKNKFLQETGTKAAKKVPVDFQTLKAKYLERITARVKQFNVPPQLIINFDETGVPSLPVSQWTPEETGSPSVSSTGLDDKRKITAVVACAVRGDLLDPQPLYQDTTDRCHPPRYVKFPEGFDIWHFSSYCSRHHTFRRYVLKILKPWATAVKAQLKLPQVQRDSGCLPGTPRSRCSGGVYRD